MFKKIKELKGVNSLSKVEQKKISGGFFGGCAAAICRDNADCHCGSCQFFTEIINGQEVLLGGICLNH